MEYQVLARKWRPKTFVDMIGQEHITRTLQNALFNEKTAHAYLFVGPRGIGKTSVARIFAKALNCEKAPIKNPCCECESCISIAEGSNIDIIEIDGASNNSVNDIRNLRDEVLYSPVKSRYKVYIIDEVHMLTNQAWNALLKTLEEPPAHVKFLFATTEVHKILPTVLSRCQRFDLRRIPENLIVEKLIEIAETENVKISKNAIRAVARAADGGMRDALSLMDQMIAFHLSEGDKEITEEEILNTFGLTGPEKIFNLVKSIINNQQSEVITAINEQAKEGKNLENLFEDILTYLRGIEICMLINDPDSVLEVGADIIERYKILGNGVQINVVQKLLEALSSSGKILHDAINKQIYVETLLLKAMRIARAKHIEDLLEKVNQLRKDGRFSDLEVELPVRIQKKQLNEVMNTLPKNVFKQSENGKPESIQKSLNNSSANVDNLSGENRKNSINEESTPDKDTFTSENQNNTNVFNTHETYKSVKKKETDVKLDNDISGQQYAGLNVEDEQPRENIPDKIEEPVVEFTAENNKPNEILPKSIESISQEKEVSDEQKNYRRSIKFDSPEKLWHALIMDMDHINQPQLKFYLQEAKPKSLNQNSITVAYDDEFGTVPAYRVNKEKALLLNCLHRITGIKDFKINIVKEKGITTPAHSIDTFDMDEVKKTIENNRFVKKTINTFNGRIVDYRG